MKKIIISSIIGLMVLSNVAYAKSVEQTICFSQEPSFKLDKRQYYRGVLSDKATLNGGKCKGKTLPQMNKLGWKVVQIVGGLEYSFVMLLEKVK